jgi:hypothetical protein
MAITVVHQPVGTGGLAAYAAGRGRNQERQRKYITDLIAKQQERRDRFALLGRRDREAAARRLQQGGPLGVQPLGIGATDAATVVPAPRKYGGRGVNIIGVPQPREHGPIQYGGPSREALGVVNQPGQYSGMDLQEQLAPLDSQGVSESFWREEDARSRSAIDEISQMSGGGTRFQGGIAGPAWNELQTNLASISGSKDITPAERLEAASLARKGFMDKFDPLRDLPREYEDGGVIHSSAGVPIRHAEGAVGRNIEANSYNMPGVGTIYMDPRTGKPEVLAPLDKQFAGYDAETATQDDEIAFHRQRQAAAQERINRPLNDDLPGPGEYAVPGMTPPGYRPNTVYNQEGGLRTHPMASGALTPEQSERLNTEGSLLQRTLAEQSPRNQPIGAGFGYQREGDAEGASTRNRLEYELVGQGRSPESAAYEAEDTLPFGGAMGTDVQTRDVVSGIRNRRKEVVAARKAEAAAAAARRTGPPRTAKVPAKDDATLIKDIDAANKRILAQRQADYDKAVLSSKDGDPEVARPSTEITPAESAKEVQDFEARQREAMRAYREAQSLAGAAANPPAAPRTPVRRGRANTATAAQPPAQPSSAQPEMATADDVASAVMLTPEIKKNPNLSGGRVMKTTLKNDDGEYEEAYLKWNPKSKKWMILKAPPAKQQTQQQPVRAGDFTNPYDLGAGGTM